MKRKVLKYFFFVFFFCFSSYSDDLHQELIKKLETIYPAEIFFEQSNNNSIIGGWMIMGGKGKVRTEFEPPNSLVIIGTGKWLIFHEAKYDRTTYLPINEGLLNSLLNPNSLKSSEDITVTRKDIKNKKVYKISSNKNKFNGNLKLVFNSEDSNNILEWIITDNNNNETKVRITKLNKLNFDTINKKPFFLFTKEMRNSEKVFLGPYERKFKKIPKSGSPGAM